MPVGRELRQLIGQGASMDAMRAAAQRDGMITLRETALGRLTAGETTLEEVVRTTALEHAVGEE